VGYHRKLRGKRVAWSELDLIPGIGEKKKTGATEVFWSVEKLRMVDVEEIVKGFRDQKKDAEEVWRYFRK